MIYTARQLEQLHRSNGHVVLPYRARLSPLAQDWLRAKKIVVGYSDAEAAVVAVAAVDAPVVSSTVAGSPLLWWGDGPAGAAKAALSAVAREAAIAPMNVPQEAKRIAAAVKHLVTEIKAGRAIGGILVVQNAAAGLIYANRCASLRAIMGTSVTALDQAMRELAPNVLVIEHPRQTLQQMKNMILRFARTRGEPGEAVKQDLKEMTSCG